MKELWVFGPLGGDDAATRARRDEQIESSVGKVAELLGRAQDDRMRDLAQRCGGSWEALGEGAGGEQQQAGAGAGSGAGTA